ncbi:DUF3800 domain-containing protein [Lentibacillus cibarius]|uniref:DUF3800 domain-containing protein n=1 Tax=Lentibacillus cibarius TaxID=2583219 RepID=A0A5S3QHZ4_9BACI|nr:DUF3800 domain-containing protein [Lentibacillus cibarius]TMN20811.1 DUF3800 domain-containing protein [Lentibacillus cibarius]
MIYIYCDESCHLENDLSNVMVLGGILVPELTKQAVFADIRKIKEKHDLSSWFEIKWTKVSQSKLNFYNELVEYFFNNQYLSFRGIIMKGKNQLDHERYGNTYDQWYYKMYYYLLDPIIFPEENYRVFIDIKDTNGGKKVNKLHEVLSNSKYDFSQEVIKDINQIHSHESEIMQLCDLFIGALSYYHRGFYLSGKNKGKQALISNIIKWTDRNLNENTPVREEKFNLFNWMPRMV